MPGGAARTSCFRLFGLLLIPAWFDGAGSPKSASEIPSVAPFSTWIDIRFASEVFRLVAGETRSYEALRHQTGGGRQDILEFSGRESEAPEFRLVIYEPGTETVLQQSFFVELALRAAETGQAITHAVQPSSLATRFGDFEVAELGLARSGGPVRECLGFRFNPMAPDRRIAGFACRTGGSSAVPLTKPALGCLIG